MLRRIPLILVMSALTTACVIEQRIIMPPGYPVNPVGILGMEGALRSTVSQVVMAAGDERDLTTLLRTGAGLLPTQPLVWKSSNDSVAMVSPNNGQTRALMPGTAILTAFINGGDGASRVSIEVNVVEKLLIKYMGITPSTALMTPGESLSLQAQVHMADGQINGNVAWSSSDNTIATVNPTTGAVSALREGKVTIVASYALDTRYKAIAELSIVKDKSAVPVPIGPSPFVFGPSAMPYPVPMPTASIVMPGQTPLPYQPASLELGTIMVSESTGNGDAVANRGETIYVQPTFRNQGSSATNALTVKMSTSAPSDVAEPYSPSYISVPAIAGGSTSTWTGDYGLGLRIKSTAVPGTEIPVTFAVTDSFGNAWALSGSITCAPIDNQLALDLVTIAEGTGNDDGVTNRGEMIYLQPTFRNQGRSATNDLTVKLSTSAPSELAQVSSPSYMSFAPIASGAISIWTGTYGLGLKISNTAAPGTSIPVVFQVQDAFGNAWNVPYAIQVQ